MDQQRFLFIWPLAALSLAVAVFFLPKRRPGISNGTSPSQSESPVENQPSTASTSSNSALPVEYEVFLSFRGPDVRANFADVLYKFLDRFKIRTFLDNEELPKGETIAPSLEKAIKESKVYVPILSQDYASSKWCLQELALMVKCCKQGDDRIILPIFYMMEPRDVRHQEGSYKKAFQLHSKKYDAETIKEWKEALKEVGEMKGWSVKESDRQGVIVDEVYSKVRSHLMRSYKLVTEDLVGIDSHVQQVTTLLSLESGSVKIVGIHAMGGMGKTTIAKAVYDQLYSQFDRFCFVEDAREILSKSDGVVTLQNKIISSILITDYKVKDASEDLGRKIVREEDSQRSWKRSRIWSNEDALDILRNGQGSDRVEVLRVDVEDENFELTDKEFKKLSRLRLIPNDLNMKKLVILEMIYCPVEDEWRGWSGIKVIGISLFISKIMNLPTSLNQLSLSSSRVLNLSELKDLEELCFDYCDELQYLGGLWKLSKLRKLQLKYLSSCNSLLVEGDDVSSTGFPLPSSLNFLEISDLESLPNFANKLRWLDIRGCAQLAEVSGIERLELLNELNISGCSSVEELPNLPGSRNIFSLDISECNQLKEFTGVKNLEQLKDLKMRNCTLITKLPDLSVLANLKTLDISGCVQLAEVSGIERLGSLKRLNISKCNQLKEVMGIKSLELLEDLVMTNCTSIKKLPDLSGCKKLWCLNISGCVQLAEVSGIERLESLKYLNMSGCSSVEELPDLSGLGKIESLDISECNQLKEVTGIESLELLEYLVMTNCTSIEKLPDLSCCKKLWFLDIKGCVQLDEDSGIDKLEGIIVVHSTHSPSISESDDEKGGK
ncbi:Disease resistance protein L6 [Linum perenne]